jgi:hypothetical protein
MGGKVLGVDEELELKMTRAVQMCGGFLFRPFASFDDVLNQVEAENCVLAERGRQGQRVARIVLKDRKDLLEGRPLYNYTGPWPGA